ncbi:hypothetical protein B296_00009456 [Ensete ventricosum]|uniref:Uncharacterized protein n=1 Tax=Ensete ventricosum TaxID=4639 RepID=A0A427AI77_ENSVE|nr:hypothetical protein B296_00009456 [Ensete ventricosum]
MYRSREIKRSGKALCEFEGTESIKRRVLAKNMYCLSDKGETDQSTGYCNKGGGGGGRRQARKQWARSQETRGKETKKRVRVRNLEELENSQSLPRLEKTMRATSASHRTDSSYAFLRRPLRRLEKVTCRLAAFSISLTSVFPLTISLSLSPNELCDLFTLQLPSQWFSEPDGL